MYTLAQRLSSFCEARPVPKRRGSSAKTQKTVSWPHQTPSVEQLAKAGFYYTPSGSSNDNVTCFLCQKSLDGWDEDDDPVLEHLHHSEQCAWAIIVAAQTVSDNPEQEQEDPLGEKMVEARRETFADQWPHEGKRGWVCQVKKMVEGGWYYCPTPESDDFVACPYCSLALDGWEPKDKPLEEHRRRSPNCPYVALFNSSGRPKRQSRLSKQSRISTQSSLTIASEAPSQDGLDPQEDSVLTTATNTSMVSKVGKKAGGNKKGTAKGKGRMPRAKASKAAEVTVVAEPEEEYMDVEAQEPPRSSRSKAAEVTVVAEPEEEYMGVEAQEPPQSPRRTKRKSDEVENGDFLINNQVGDEGIIILSSPQQPESGAKRRKSNGLRNNENLIQEDNVDGDAPDTPSSSPARELQEENKSPIVAAAACTDQPGEESVTRQQSSRFQEPGGEQDEINEDGIVGREEQMQPIEEVVTAPTSPLGLGTPSSQTSDVENQPPSSRHTLLPTPKPANTQSPSTPQTSPSKRNMLNGASLKSTMPWSAVDLEAIFLASPTSRSIEDKEMMRASILDDAIEGVKGMLTSPEKRMTLEEWVKHNAVIAEEKLRRECERLVGIFEKEGNRALQVLEGIVVAN